MSDEQNVTPEEIKPQEETPKTENPKPEPPKTPEQVSDKEPEKEPGTMEELPEWAQREIRTTRNEAKNLRERMKTEIPAAVEAAKKDLAQEIGKALGLVTEETDPEKLLATAQAEAAAKQEIARKAQLELAIYRSAESNNADGHALLDSRAFMEKAEKLDPNTDDYATQVEALVKETVESDKKWRKAQAAPASTTGTPLGSAPQTEKNDIDEYRSSYRDRRGILP